MSAETPHRSEGDIDAGSGGEDKAALRARLLAARRALPAGQRQVADERLVAALVTTLREVRTVAGFLPFGSEPCATASPCLPEALRASGVRVLLPVLLPDLDLDWAWYDGRLVAATRGLHEPVGPRSGPDAVAAVDAVVVPAVAVDHRGVRLGRGGGSYDRALARVPAGIPVIAPLYEAEFVARLPLEPHDREVSMVITPDRGPLRLPA